MVISLSFGLQINEVACSAEPEELVALMTKLAVPVKLTLEILTVFPEKLKATGDPFCVTEMFCFSDTFSTVAVREATQFSTVTGEDAGVVIVTTGAGITGQVP